MKRKLDKIYATQDQADSVELAESFAGAKRLLTTPAFEADFLKGSLTASSLGFDSDIIERR